MTWIWDRNRQTWVEILDKPVEEEHSTSIETHPGSVVQSVEPGAATSIEVRPEQSKPARVMWRTLTSINSAVRIFNSRSQLRGLSGHRDSDKDIEEHKVVITTPFMDKEIGNSTKLVLRDAEIQANKIISWIEERGRLWADTIIAQAEQKAKDQADIIISTATESALHQAESILADAEEKADELAKGIVSKAILKARTKADNILRRTETKAEELAASIISRAELDARNKADELLALAKAKTIGSGRYVSTGAANGSTSDPEMSTTPLAIQRPETGNAAGSYHAEKKKQELITRQEYDSIIHAPAEAGILEIVIEPPVNTGDLKNMLTRISQRYNAKVVSISGSTDKGSKVKLLVLDFSQLDTIVDSITETEKPSSLQVKNGQKSLLGHLTYRLNKANKLPAKKLIVRMTD